MQRGVSLLRTIAWDRGRCAVARLPALYLERLENMYEESDDAKYEVGRLTTEYRGFMKRHTGFLLNSPVPQWSGNRKCGPQAAGAPARGTEEGMKLGNGQTP
jgi:hypothetical protein